MTVWALLPAALALLAAAPFLRERMRPEMDARARESAPGAFAKLSQGVTHFRWIGPKDGPVVVCIHGQTTPSPVWQGLAPHLVAEGYRLLTYDLYGRGLSDRPGGVQDAVFFQQQLIDLLEDQQVTGELILIGHSMGGAIATSFAAAQPGRIGHLVLIASAGVELALSPLGRFITRTPIIGDWLVLAFYPRQHRANIDAERNLPASIPELPDIQRREMAYRGFLPAVLSSARGILASPLRTEHETLAARNVPVLAIWGDQDPLIPPTAREKLATWNPDARQEVIAGGGHGLPYTDTDAITRLLRDIM